MTSGDKISLMACDAGWGPSNNLMRVEHSTLVRPNPQGGTTLVTYVMGGPGTLVWAYTAFPSGYPGYSGDDPNEWEFYVEKAGGGPISQGDEVSIRIDPSRTGVGPYWFRVTGPEDGAYIGGDGTIPFQGETSFLAEFTEVRPGLGLRPTTVICQSCAQVTGTVVGRQGVAVEGARVTSEGDSVRSHPFLATTDANGRFKLEDGQSRDCIPPGPLSIKVEADTYVSRDIAVDVPGQGRIDVGTVQLVCTIVEGKVVEVVGNSQLPLPGVEVNLTYPETGDGIVTTTDPIDGVFRFECVRHVRATVSTDFTSPQQVADPIPDVGVRNVLIVVSRRCVTISGTVTDATNNTRISGAKVTVQNTSPAGVLTATTDESGNYTITGVCLTGRQSLKASKEGYRSAVKPTGELPVTGTVTVDFQLQPQVVNPDGSPVPHVIDCTLAWGAGPSQPGGNVPVPRDLDSHLSGPDPSGSAPFHCYYSQRAPVDFVALDRDDVDWAGPEHIVVSPRQVAGQSVPVPGDYHYWVHNFSGEKPFDQSDARVTVSIDGQQRAQFYVSGALGDQSARIWRVFDFSIAADGTVTISRLQLGGQPAPDGILRPGSASDVF
ncbi:carboxypeptidase-like regulatory domain-containing protein [Streptomyces sp. UNOB3_S3]|uniref:carboxypeptidase-like regulatory domain-containing protein n=1 Tax=Streptomyces sp. UNOB3_S3 TaxID=2871682 RepID=UPI001E57D860|nr:carboxypeptidase-like regulatory domain-containing protein [Streptomyces sp. UNOB3_S3]MCC3773615.1 carboxypeptidase-like regulatory domain-containing protein [Streptomyces sp. UNOB3_S3]